MMLENVVVFIAATGVLITALILVLHQEYDDGFVGRAALALLAIGAFSRMVGIASADFTVYITGPGILCWCGLGMFLGRHLYRFIRNYYDGSYAWKSLRGK